MSRNIKPELVKIIDDKLVNNGSAQLAIKNKDARNIMIYAAEACVGETESGGNNNGKFVSLCQKTVDNVASSEPWCLAFVESMVAYAELKSGQKSNLYPTEHCLTAWRNAKVVDRVKSIPAPGAIIIWQHGSSESGHTGFVSEYKTKTMETIEGNTGASFRDGDGVYKKNRSTKKDGDMKVVGFIIPFPLIDSVAQTEPVVTNRISLSWESDSYPERKKWSDWLVNEVNENLSIYDGASDLLSLIPNYKSLSSQKKVTAICELIVAICYFESGFKPTSRMVETTMGIDPVTGKQVASEGLMQLSYQDVLSYAKLLKGCGIDWSKDKGLSTTDPNKTIFNPIFNLDAGTRILKNQITNKGSITLKSGVYWAVLKIGGKYTQINNIIARVQKHAPLCK